MTTSNMNQGQLVNNIKSLQTLEQKLYLDLEKLPKDNSSINLQKEIISKINNLSQSRIALYNQLHSIYLILNNNISTERQDLKEQSELIKITEKHLNKSKNIINKHKNLDSNNLRLLEINDYYSKQYNAYNNILRYIIYLCLPLLILGVLQQLNLIPSTIINILGIIILTIGLIFIISKIIDLYMRDNMQFDEYNQSRTVNPDASDDIIEPDEKTLSGLLDNKYLQDLKLLEKGDCLGPECCSSGQIYHNNKCIIAPQH